jgi:sugar/nucleoside kinase (ribokinase family)
VPEDAVVSFDPNIRPELLTVDQIRDLCLPVIDRAGVVLPSMGEAAMLTGEPDDALGCRSWSNQGKLVVLKRGVKGCRMYRDDDTFDVPGFHVEEIDPTGAGDSFSAGITVGLLEDMDLIEAGRFANAVGALAVTRKGPMEGAPTRDEVTQFMRVFESI